MWEAWENTARSHDHAFLGTVDDWLYQRVAGIEPAAPGYAKITIQPYPVGDLTNRRGPRGLPARSGELDVDPQGRPLSPCARACRRRDSRDPRPATSRAAVNAPRDATFTGMRDGYAAFQVGSGSYVFSSAM